jgi:hypothetical protein
MVLGFVRKWLRMPLIDFIGDTLSVFPGLCVAVYQENEVSNIVTVMGF